jgi:GTP cyclohydrolase II
MKNDLDKLQLNLEYGQIIKFNNKYNILNPTDENFKKYGSRIKDSEIALPIFLLKFHGIEIKTSENFLKFKLEKNPKKIQSFFTKRQNIKRFINLDTPQNLDANEKKLINIFKKLNILPFPILLKDSKKKNDSKVSFNINEISKSLNISKVVFRNSTSLPLKNNHDVKILLFDDTVLKSTHYALVFNENSRSKKTNVRIHSSCLTGDLMGSQRCDCGYQLNTAIDYMNNNPSKGVIVYLNQEGRGLGIHNKIISYNIQETGWDTYAADKILGFSGDERDYKSAIKILKYLKVNNINLITNNPEKISSLNKNGIKVSQVIKIRPGVNKFNKEYMRTKKNIGKHLLNL